MIDFFNKNTSESLPYKRLEYIQSSPGQYIQTNANYTNNTSFDLTVMILEAVAWRSLLQAGSFQLQIGNANATTIYALRPKTASPGYENLSISGVTGLNTKMYFNARKNNFGLNGKTGVVCTNDAFTRTGLRLFTGESDYGLKVRCYAFNVYENDTMVRQYIPVEMNDGRVGLWDLIEEKFYGDGSGGNFIAGPYVPDTIDNYVKLEYLENTGDAYINTKVETISGYRIKTRLSITNWYGSSACYFAGFLGENTYRDYTVFYESKPMLGMNTDVSSNMVASLNTWYDVDMSTISGNGYINIDSDEILTSTNTVSHSMGHVWLFGVNNNNTGKVFNCYAKIGNTQIYNEIGTLVRNFIPVKRKSDNTLGMYDLLNNKFYTNAGTDAFIAGPELYIKEKKEMKHIKIIKIPLALASLGRNDTLKLNNTSMGGVL